MIFNETEKQKSRQLLLDAYYKRYKSRKIPAGKQYWTLCAECVTGGVKARLVPGTELEQLVRTNFINFDQFHGVDKDLKTINKNKLFRSKSGTMPLGGGPWWHHGDLFSIISSAHKAGVFNPAVIHYDSMLGPTKAMHYASRLMSVISNVKGPVMFATNVALQWKWSVKNAMRPRTLDDIVFALSRNPSFRPLFASCWDPNVEFFSYPGLKDNLSRMGTVIMFKR